MTVPATMKAFFGSVLIGAGTLLSSLPAQGSDTEITGEYTLDRDSPGRATFKNTSTKKGICIQRPDLCESQQVSHSLATLETWTSQLKAGQSDPRNGAMIKLDTAWRNVTLEEPSSKEQIQIRFRLVGFNGRYFISPNADVITGISDPVSAHAALWQNGTWDVPEGPCIASALNETALGSDTFYWKFPASPSQCHKKILFDAGFSLSTHSLVYEIEAPELLAGAGGDYVSLQDLVYSIGPNRDIDFGDFIAPIKDSHSYKFIITVAYSFLKVTFKGPLDVELAPQGGWPLWQAQGRPPAPLVGEIDYELEAGGTFDVKIQCGTDFDTRSCGISNPAGHKVPVSVYADMPTGFLPATALLSKTNTAFDAKNSSSRPAKLRFEVPEAHMKDMLKHEGTNYTGDITVVWDAG